ncbi:glycoside hydrolase family 3 N-terminal domain-containing protein [Flavobacterium lacus]|uniref:beta-N-acetylhexosaminidase n=1 Tax=Flavobacterium lacus TaxID=1353778 RepID=A0A328WU46_9FLAO|nr:glycoside hydrolase family 3 N-terminal domain-containing protein [Flavobacterium lacus]RAR47374.1 beta-glucosidase-like glycosyl hydrolase [Flavobacterium lacus]
MKSKFVRIIPLLLILIVVVNCATNKVRQKAVVKTEHDSIKTNSVKPIKKEIPQFDYVSTTTLEKKWVDSIYNSLTVEERIGQLFMVAAYSNKDSAHIKSLDKLILEQKIGGLIFFQGGPVRQAQMTNRFQKLAKTPLFIGIDAEWGLSMRLDSVNRFPWNMTLGAVQDLKLIEETGKQMALQSKRIGVHFNFAPVLDINTNPKNPIIGNRSFGEDKEKVSDRALALMTGLQRNGVFATGKHFPGHGATSTDSHYTLPVVNFTQEHIREVELLPYKKLISKGLASVMVAHLEVPSFEARKGFPSSISYPIVTNLLKEELNFKGLIFTDALNMKGASNFKSPGDIDLAAFLAGNDILLFPENVPVAIQKIKEAYDIASITEERLASSVKKILQYKFKAGLKNQKPIELTNLSTQINTQEDEALLYKLYENSITVIKNKLAILPIKELDQEKIAYVKFGDDSHETFFETLKKYAEITEVSNENLDSLLAQLNDFNKVIIGFHKADGAWKKHDFTAKEILWISEIAKRKKVILTCFVKPYALSAIPSFENIDGVIVAYQNNEIAHNVTAQLIFGAIQAKGKLPVTINDEFKVNHGLSTEKINRLGFTHPQNVGMNPFILTNIDLIMQKAINEKMTPGGQILVARKGKVIYQKSFGFHGYDKQVEVKNSDIYDVASLTKIVSTLPNVMQLYDKKTINLDSKLGEMLPVFKGTDKENINFKDLLSHYARLQAWIPFYKKTLDKNNKPSDKYYRKTFSEDFPFQVAENLYLRKDYQDTILTLVANSKLLPKKEYKYSDFTFIILKNYIERATGKSLDELSEKNFYSKIGANNTLYNPLQKFDMSIIPPTEDDNYYRYKTIQGYVHDMTAAMEGGVGGHAGIFSNSMDMAKIMQLFLQKGTYGGQRFFSEETFDVFNTCYYCPDGNRRGIGFDKPQLGKSGPTCGCASMTSFGHTGFTGTMAWADPEQELVYIFLSNRTYPNADKNLLSQKNIREDIQQVIYDAIIHEN